MTKTAWILCDTGVVSRYLTGVPGIAEKVVAIGKGICVSVVTRMELLNWLSNYRGLSPKRRMEVLKAIKKLHVIHVNEAISELAMGFSDSDVVAKPADLLIGATTYHYGLPLFTLNTKDFARLGVEMA